VAEKRNDRGPEKAPGSIRIAAVGDILLSDGYFDAGCGMGSLIKKQGPSFPFEGMRDYFQGVDILIGNLESAVSDRTIRKGLRANEFLAAPSAIDGLKQAGFNLLLVANNHILQHGAEAYRDTVRRVGRAGMEPVGHTPGGTPQGLATIERKGRTFGVLGYSMTEDEHNPDVKEYAHYRDMERIIKDVRLHRGRCDYLMLLMHWGDEYVRTPSPGQIELAHTLVDEGVDIIIGSHPHVLQAVEVYRGKTIAYSLGNFVFNMPAEFCRQSALLSIELGGGGSQRHILKPVWIDDNGRPGVAGSDKEEEIEKTIKTATRHFEQSKAGKYPYEEMKEKGLSIHRQAQKKQFMQNILKMKKRWALRLIYEFFKRRMAA